MAVDKAELSESQSRALAQKRQAVQNEENSLEADRARAARARIKEAQLEKDKTDKQIVEISKAAETQVESIKKMNSERVKSLNENSEKNYVAVAASTAEKIKGLEQDALKVIADHNASSMERLKFVTDQSEDPFYRVKSLNPVLGESEKEFTIKVSLPEHEAQNVFASGEGDKVKIALSRRYQNGVEDKENSRATKTHSYQTIVEQFEMPSAFETKKIFKEYKDGILTVHVPKKISQVKI